jgi:hypothetical protein
VDSIVSVTSLGVIVLGPLIILSEHEPMPKRAISGTFCSKERKAGSELQYCTPFLIVNTNIFAILTQTEDPILITIFVLKAIKLGLSVCSASMGQP